MVANALLRMEFNKEQEMICTHHCFIVEKNEAMQVPDPYNWKEMPNKFKPTKEGKEIVPFPIKQIARDQERQSDCKSERNASSGNEHTKY